MFRKSRFLIISNKKYMFIEDAGSGLHFAAHRYSSASKH